MKRNVISNAWALAAALRAVRYFVAAIAVTALLQANAVAQTGIPTIPTVELTEKAARDALKAYHEMRETFEGQEISDNDAKSMAQAMMLHTKAQSIVQSHGFADPNEWHTTLISFVLAYGAIREGNLEKMKTSIAQLEATPGLPEETKKQMMDQMRALIPSDNNIAVTKAVSADPDFAGGF